ncbi:MAG: hypothetical protein ABSA30_11525, partial [Candidatus Aminicenantales bacterium]
MPLPIKKAIVALLAGAFACSAADAQTRKFYIANDDHTDYMWVADEASCREAFLEMLDYYLDLADSTSGAASDFRSR